MSVAYYVVISKTKLYLKCVQIVVTLIRLERLCKTLFSSIIHELYTYIIIAHER